MHKTSPHITSQHKVRNNQRDVRPRYICIYAVYSFDFHSSIATMPSQTLNMPPREKKRKSDQMASDAHNALPVLSSDAHHQSDMSSPAKKRKVGITLAQKQALIDNLQLEGS